VLVHVVNVYMSRLGTLRKERNYLKSKC
jgi:hypothetical protein